MAADYQTGTASSPVNLLQTIVSWLVGQGYTSDASAIESSGWRSHLHKGSQYVSMRAAMDEQIWTDLPGGFYDAASGYGIGFYLGTGYSGAAAWDDQAGRPVRAGDGSTIGSGMNLPSGPVTAYHFFDDGQDNIAIVVEKSPGVFVGMFWGPDLEDSGSADPHWWFTGSSSSNLVTYEGDAIATPGHNLTMAAPLVHSQYQLIASLSQVASNGFVRVAASVFADRWLSNGNFDSDNFLYSGRFLGVCINDSPLNFHVREFPNFQYFKSRTNQTAYPDSLLLPLWSFVLMDPSGRWAPLGYPRNVFYFKGVGAGFTAGQVYQLGGQDYMVFPNFAVRKDA